MNKTQDTLIKINRPIDHFSAEKYKKYIFKIIDEGQTQIMLDFDKVDYLDSGGVALVIDIIKKIRPLGGVLNIINVDSNVNRIFEIAGLRLVASSGQLKITKKYAETAYIGDEHPVFIPKLEEEFIYRSNPMNLEKIRKKVKSLLLLLRLSPQILYDVIVCISEACSNAIEHSKKSKDHDIKVKLKYELGKLFIEVIDFGKGFDEEDLKCKPMIESQNGRGVFIMKHLMDDVKFCKNNTHFSVRLTKKIVDRNN